MPDLPIEEVLPALADALRARPSAVLQAPPGAGKTTRVPLALLGEPWLAGQRVVMLEPRRLATRAAARRMAETLGERVGQTVGYRVRMDSAVGPDTRVEVVTEGILTRRLQADPALEGVGLVIFDEFHERNLHGDLGLALCLQSRAVLRDDLRILVMSATLEGERVAALLGGAPVVTSRGRSYPVQVHYAARRPAASVEAAVAGAVRRAVAEHDGDVLAFLPGAGEIRRAEAALAEGPLPAGVRVAPLFGDLPQGAQDAAIRPSAPGERKVVLATSIAETSLTIEGVRVVVDGGLARVPRFSPRTGMTSLETVRVTRASADQRCGRAGRLGPGVCYRLWPEHEQHHLLPHATPEILEADLAPLALELAAVGVADPAELAWLDPPPPAAFGQARELLAQLGALGDDGRVTAHGRRMAALGLHPRLAHMLLRGAALGHAALACDLAALLGERDVLRGDAGPPQDADVRLRLEALAAAGDAGGPRGSPAFVRGYAVDREACRRVRAESRQWQRQLRAAEAEPRGASARVAGDASGLLLAFAYPDRVGQRRPGQGGRFLLRNGRGAALAAPQPLSDEAYVVAAELDGRRPESRIFLAAPLALEDLLEHFGAHVVHEDVVAWDGATQSVLARRRERLGALVLKDAPLRDPDPDAVLAALLGGLSAEGVAALPWSDAARRLQARIAFMHRLDPRWPDVSDATLAATLGEWLAPHAYGMRRRAELQRVDMAAVLEGMLTWGQRRALDEEAPTHVVVPSGSRIPVDYGDPAAPVLAVRLQEMFGATETPRVAGGRVPLTLHLLSPAHRPVQVTRDLAGFWRSAYFEVRKDLKGRYPKHHWPDDPLRAEPTSRAKRRG
jgi:ATP-dependent helicase HrpB